MKTIIVTLLLVLLNTGCGSSPSGTSPAGSPVAQDDTEFSLYQFYEVDLEGHQVRLLDLDVMPLNQSKKIQYSVDGFNCTADAILNKPGALNLYNLQVSNMTAIITSDPVQMTACDAGKPSDFWLRLTGKFTMDFTRAN